MSPQDRKMLTHFSAKVVPSAKYFPPLLRTSLPQKSSTWTIVYFQYKVFIYECISCHCQVTHWRPLVKMFLSSQTAFWLACKNLNLPSIKHWATNNIIHIIFKKPFIFASSFGLLFFYELFYLWSDTLTLSDLLVTTTQESIIGLLDSQAQAATDPQSWRLVVVSSLPRPVAFKYISSSALASHQTSPDIGEGL